MKWCLVACFTVGVLLSFSAEAQQYPVLIHPQNNEICPIENYNAYSQSAFQANRAEYGIIKRIVYCVQGLVIPAAYQMLYQFSVNYLYAPIAAACTLAVLFWGFLMVVGKKSAPMREAFLVALKIGAVMTFTFVLGMSDIWPYGLFPVIIDIVDELASIVTYYIGYTSTLGCANSFVASDVWGRVDCALNSIVGGVFNPALLMGGIAGFFLSALFSGTFGMFIALIGFAIIFFLIFAILRATYVTITAYVAIALMAVVSPIFITMLLFKATYGYFEKWLKLTIGFMLQPLFLFAYLSMMLAAFDTVVYDGPFSIYRSLVGSQYIGSYPSNLPPYPNNSSTNPHGDFKMGYWLYNYGVYRQAEAAAVGVGTNPRLDSYIASTNVGIGGTTGVSDMPSESFNRRDGAGILINVLDNYVPKNVFRVDLPIKKIAWQQMALMYNNQSGAGMTQEQLDNIRINYLIQVLLAVLIAFLTMYIFYLLLDLLPFIGSGIAGDRYSMPTLGQKGRAGDLGMPGDNKIFKNMKAGMSKLASGGGG